MSHFVNTFVNVKKIIGDRTGDIFKCCKIENSFMHAFACLSQSSWWLVTITKQAVMSLQGMAEKGLCFQFCENVLYQVLHQFLYYSHFINIILNKYKLLEQCHSLKWYHCLFKLQESKYSNKQSLVLSLANSFGILALDYHWNR